MSMETELAALKARVESLEQRVLTIDQPKWKPTHSPYDCSKPIEAYSSKLRRKR